MHKLLPKDVIARFVLNQVDSLLDVMNQKRLGNQDYFAVHLLKLMIKVVGTTSKNSYLV